MNPICPYCGKKSDLVTGKAIYPHRPDLYHLSFYQCAPCDAYVGCHSGTTEPLGRLANAELRQAKMKAHLAFDPLWKALWKSGQSMARSQAYVWLAWKLGIPVEECHIGMFDVAQCQRVEAVCLERNKGDGLSKQGG